MTEILQGKVKTVYDVESEPEKVKIVFHPMMASAKNPDAKLFTLKISNADIAKLKKAL